MSKVAHPRIDYIEPAFDRALYPYRLRSGRQTWELRLVAPEAEKNPVAKLEGTVSQEALLAQVSELLGQELAPWLASSCPPRPELSSEPGIGEQGVTSRPDLNAPLIGNPFREDPASPIDEAPDIAIVALPPRKNSKLPARKPTKIRVALRVPEDLLEQATLLAALERATLGAGLVGSENLALLATPLTTIAYQCFLGATSLPAAQEAGVQYRMAASLIFESFLDSGGSLVPHAQASVATVHEILSLSDLELYLLLTEARYPGNGRKGGQQSRWPRPPYEAAELKVALNRLLAEGLLEAIYHVPGRFGYSWAPAHEILSANPNFDLASAEFFYRRGERLGRDHLANNAGRILGLF